MSILPKNITVLQIIPELSAGGAEQGCLDVAAGLTQAGARAIVVSNGGTRLHELSRAGAEHIQLPVNSKNPLIMRHNAKKLHDIIIKKGINIVHARSRAPAWSAWQACKKTDAHFITTAHAPYNTGGKMKQFYNSSIARGERVIAISNYVAEYLRKNFELDNRTVRLIPRGIALEKFHPTAVTPERMINLAREWRIPDGANVIMLPGRLTRWKGFHVLVEAMSHLRRPDIFCVMIGSDQGNTKYRKELEETIQEKELGGHVRLVEHCDDMPAAYMLSTVVVSASTEPEGFGRIAVESQAMGRPTIATDHGGAQETIKRGETGWLITPSDPLALAGAIEEALSLNGHQRAVLATRAMAHVAQNFTREIMVERTLSVYAEILGSRQYGYMSSEAAE